MYPDPDELAEALDSLMALVMPWMVWKKHMSVREACCQYFARYNGKSEAQRQLAMIRAAQGKRVVIFHADGTKEVIEPERGGENGQV